VSAQLPDCQDDFTTFDGGLAMRLRRVGGSMGGGIGDPKLAARNLSDYASIMNVKLYLTVLVLVGSSAIVGILFSLLCAFCCCDGDSAPANGREGISIVFLPPTQYRKLTKRFF